MLLEEFKKPKRQEQREPEVRKKYFGQKENIELNRINQRFTFQQDQEYLGDLIHKPTEKSPFFIDEMERFRKRDFSEMERENREKAVRRKNKQLTNNVFHHLQREKVKWDKIDKNFIEAEKTAQQRMKNRRENNFNYAQGFNLINMKYENSKKGNMLKQKDMMYQEKNNERAKKLFHLNNNEYDIFTGKTKKFRTIDILDKFID